MNRKLTEAEKFEKAGAWWRAGMLLALVAGVVSLSILGQVIIFGWAGDDELFTTALHILPYPGIPTLVGIVIAIGADVFFRRSRRTVK